MRIAIFHNLPSGGAKRALAELSSRLSARHELDVYALQTADHAFCDLRPHARSHAIYPFERARLFDSPIGRLNQLQRWRELGRLDRLQRQVASDIDRRGCDVVFVQPCLITTIPLVLCHLRSRAVYYLHEPFGRAAIPPPDSEPPRGRAVLDRVDPLLHLYRRRLDRSQLASVLATPTLLANSAFTRERTRQGYGRDAIECPLGVDGQVFRPLPHVVRGRHVLSVGEFSPRKGHGWLVEALARIPVARRPALRLVCNAVDAAERSRVERLANARGVELQVLVGLDRDALVRQYNEAALCVYAPFNEPFGLVALEAMACATAVVGIREGGVMESVVDGETGVLAPRDPDTFGAAVSDLLSTPALCAEYGRAARVRALEHWSWEHSVEGIERGLREAA